MNAQALIGGEWVAPASGRTFEVRSPADGSLVGQAADCGADETRCAIEAAAAAFEDWSGRPASDRAGVLLAASRAIFERQDELARLLAREGGKPIAEARGEVAYAAGFLDYFAEESTRRRTEGVQPAVAGKRLRTVQQPVGVSGLITVWNFPAAGITRPLGAALAAGCTAVVKPAEKAPLCAAAILDILGQAGLPPGAANLILSSDPEPVGRELVSNPRVRKISFTGSAAVGKRLMRDCAQQVKRITLELGGHAPMLVFADADLDAAAEGAVRSKFRNSGQTCVAVNRIYVQEPVVAEFIERLIGRVSQLVLGDPLDEAVQVGPLIDAAAVEKVEAQVQDALAKGARTVIGGRRGTGDGLDRGFYFEPTVLADATDDMMVMREETFGPLAPVTSFTTEDEAIARANGLPVGLAGFAYTRDFARTRRVAAALEFGIVGVNDPLPGAPQAPFGGIKESGIGKEGGRLGLQEFLETKLLSEVLDGA